MDKKELRIGNKLMQGEVLELRRTFARLSCRDSNGNLRTSLIHYEDLKPILLNEKEIEQFPTIVKQNKDFPAYRIRERLLHYINGNWIDYASRTQITTVHELQNFYYYTNNYKEL